MQGTVLAIYTAPSAGADMVSVGEVRAVPGRGLEGDRYFESDGTFSNKPGPAREVTLIESEAVEALQRDYSMDFTAAESRRNIVTRGVALNHLVGRDFKVGGVSLRGIRLCEPCGYLDRITGKELGEPLAHRGGLRAQVLSEGVVKVGDAVLG